MENDDFYTEIDRGFQSNTASEFAENEISEFIMPDRITSVSRIVFSNNLIEFMYFNKHTREKKKSIVSSNSNSLAASVSRAKSKVKRLVYCNAFEYGSCYPKKMELTFEDNIKDLSIANNIYNNFMKRLNYNALIKVEGGRKLDLSYITVPEFQKRGAVHYHSLLFNLPYIEKARDAIRLLWNNFGQQVHLRAIKDPHIATSYVTKYITKQYDDDRYFRKKRYFPSRNLKLPLFIDDDEIAFNLRNEIEKTPSVRKYEFNNEYFGYASYILDNKIKLSPLQYSLAKTYR